MMPQFKSTVRIWCLFSLWICMITVGNIDVHRKGVPMASDMVNRPEDVGDVKMCIPDQVF